MYPLLDVSPTSTKAVKQIPNNRKCSGIICLARFNSYLHSELCLYTTFLITSTNSLANGSFRLVSPLPPGHDAALSLALHED